MFLLGELSASYDANAHTPVGPWGAWFILVPVAGAIGVAFLVKTFAPEAKGHGVPEVMDAIYYDEGGIRKEEYLDCQAVNKSCEDRHLAR